MDVVSGMTHEEGSQTSKLMGPYTSTVRMFVEDMLQLQSGGSITSATPVGSFISGSATLPMEQKQLVARIIELLKV
jgi:hypothetical protein